MGDAPRRSGAGAPRLSARTSILDKKPTGSASSSSTSTLSSGPLKTSGGIKMPSPTLGRKVSPSTTAQGLKTSTGFTAPSISLTSPTMTGGATTIQHGRSASSNIPSLMQQQQLHHNRSSGSLGGMLSFGKSPLISRVQSQSHVGGHSRKGSRGGSSAHRYASNQLSYQDYVDEELFYSTPTEEDDEEFDQIRNLLNSEYSVTTTQATGPLKGSNLVVLSWKGSEEGEGSVEQEQLANDQRDLAFIKDQLNKTNSLSNQMVFILDRFNDGLSDLEREVQPINASMKEWSTKYNNINDAMDSIRSVLDKFDISKVEQKIREGAKGDYESYMLTLEQIVSSIDFLSSKDDYKSADKSLSVLRELKQLGLTELENNFKSLLVKISNLVDPTTIPPLPASKRYLVITSPSAVEEISKSIELFSKLHYTSFIKEYKDKRSKFILLSLRKMAPEKYIKLTQESKNLAYVKGTHPLISYVFETLRLYQIESDLCKELFGDQYHTILEDVIDPAHELLLETAEPIIKTKRVTDRIFGIFPLLDLFETFTKLLPEFSNAISARDANHITEIKDLISTLELTCSSLLEFNLGDDSSKKDQTSEQSTTVDEVSSNMLNYFKRLIEYRNSVESLLSKVKSSFNEFLEKTLRNLIKYLQTKSAKESELKSSLKGYIFLINNYKYVVTSLKNANILDSQSYLLREFETCLENEIKLYSEYWNNVVEQLKFNKTKDDTKAIVKKHSSFLKQFNEITKLKFDIPDQDLKNQLKHDTKLIITKIYDKYKEMCRQDKIHLEKNFTPFESTEDIGKKIDKMFENQL
ncbi:exocyst complex subunit 7 [Cavenderia fasciculata]|uniref:Exocyst subunit Exo70 family protein n=1 Tax=Cavenderia fasciculata TaxID=261658 RepID=F4PJB8_CACFS|nr:exocyst complex subunit 7 [Cavenderia fasciculata]EGG24404.1 exocyst complex subunit 7 [Cavenderia fasciculata]|eukprot:XP_004362255.1 exocyst complex subunit 7 [Cavenderia fasciculata]